MSDDYCTIFVEYVKADHQCGILEQVGQAMVAFTVVLLPAGQKSGAAGDRGKF